MPSSFELQAIDKMQNHRLNGEFYSPPPLPQRVVNIPHTCNFEGGDEFDAVWIGVTNEGKEVKQKGIVKDNKVS